MEKWTQKRPTWCPKDDCQFTLVTQDLACAGRLPEPELHDGVENDCRFCLRGMADGGGVFSLQINKGDAYAFERLFTALYPKDGV